MLTASSTHANDSGRGRHKQFYAVPAPGEVAVDGKLDDWDLSGQIEMFVIESTRSAESARIAAMYEDHALYLSGEIRDTSPMMNRHDPKVNPRRAWDADALQFRITGRPRGRLSRAGDDLRVQKGPQPQGQPSGGGDDSGSPHVRGEAPQEACPHDCEKLVKALQTRLLLRRCWLEPFNMSFRVRIHTGFPLDLSDSCAIIPAFVLMRFRLAATD
jgi:hypothetical protein